MTRGIDMPKMSPKLAEDKEVSVVKPLLVVATEKTLKSGILPPMRAEWKLLEKRAESWLGFVARIKSTIMEPDFILFITILSVSWLP
jgi:hypothetical protein